MKELIITVAGTATRFNRDTNKDTLKCLYHTDRPDYSLLSQILKKSTDVDRFIIVGGYLYEELCSFAETNLKDYLHKIELVYNPYYREYGSGYSLIKGIEALSEKADEVIFVEGDLFFDVQSYDKVINSSKNVLTINREFILSDKAVALYVDTHKQIHYIYDTSHKYLSIPEPFEAIYNSGQIWKFTSLERLLDVVSDLTDEQIKGTNLEIIQNYFGDLSFDEYEIVPINVWYNCNTVADYQKVYLTIKQDENIK